MSHSARLKDLESLWRKSAARPCATCTQCFTGSEAPKAGRNSREKMPVDLQSLMRWHWKIIHFLAIFILCIGSFEGNFLPIWILMSHVGIPHPSASLKEAVCPWKQCIFKGSIPCFPFVDDNHWIVAVDQWHPHPGPALPPPCHSYQDFSALIRPRNPDRLEICTQLTSVDLEVTEGILSPLEFMSLLRAPPYAHVD